MKLVRYGAKGAEKPGLIDKSGQLATSAHEGRRRDILARGGEEAQPHAASLPALSGNPPSARL